jgi:hypothetical protein
MDAQGSLTGRYFPYEFVPWAFTVREVRVLCVSCLVMSSPNFRRVPMGTPYALRETARHFPYRYRGLTSSPTIKLSTSGNSVL